MKSQCPVCNNETKWESNPYRPFCSRRCKLVDLGAWLGEKYRIPGQKVDKNQKEEAENDSEVTH